MPEPALAEYVGAKVGTLRGGTQRHQRPLAPQRTSMHSILSRCCSCCSCCSCLLEVVSCVDPSKSHQQDPPRKQPWLPCTSQRACCSPASAATALQVGLPAAAGACLASAHLKTPWLHSAAAGCSLGRAELMQGHLQEVWAGKIVVNVLVCLVSCPSSGAGRAVVGRVVHLPCTCCEVDVAGCPAVRSAAVL